LDYRFSDGCWHVARYRDRAKTHYKNAIRGRNGVNSMINWAIASRWQNWFIVFLMFAIGMTGAHIFIDFIDKD
jgi:hypothetical protein